MRFALSEKATVTVTICRRGTTKILRSTSSRLAAGTRTTTLRAPTLRRAGRYTATVTARDAADNRRTPDHRHADAQGELAAALPAWVAFSAGRVRAARRW